MQVNLNVEAVDMPHNHIQRLSCSAGVLLPTDTAPMNHLGGVEICFEVRGYSYFAAVSAARGHFPFCWYHVQCKITQLGSGAVPRVRKFVKGFRDFLLTPSIISVASSTLCTSACLDKICDNILFIGMHSIRDLFLSRSIVVWDPPRCLYLTVSLKRIMSNRDDNYFENLPFEFEII